jgi:riboflavin kinase/FMN adenylyltransferase
VVAIGVFDGVHVGHRTMLDQGRAIADERHLPLVVVTFHPHPVSVLRPGSEPKQLATIRHRIELLSEAGADAVNLLEFTADLSQTEPQEWVRQTLASMPARSVVVGENFRFGRKAAGDVGLLRELGKQYDFDVTTVPLHGDGDEWSSSRIRQCIERGDMAAARAGLARNHRVEGLVVQGDRRGRDLGYPTANINPLAAGYGGPVAIPADGVYAGWLLVNPHRPGTTTMPAAISVGTNPTFGSDGPRRVEAFVLDQQDLSLYNQLVAIEFAAKLRDQIAFPDADSLVAQMHQDVAQARSILAG